MQRRALGTTLRRYDKDPPSTGSSRQPTVGNMFDLGRLAEAMKKGTVQGIPSLPYPNDNLLAATMMNLGMPRFAAEQVRYNPQLRLKFVRLWCAVQLAAEGNPAAKERVDVARAHFAEARRLELVADRPNMSAGIWDR